MAAQTYPTYTPRVGAYNEANWKPLMSQRLDPGHVAEVHQFGMLSNYFDLLEYADRSMNLTTDTPSVFEKAEWEVAVTTGTDIAAGAAGADITFTIAASDRDTVTKGDVILIPGQYQTAGVARQYAVTDVTSSVVTAKPRTADGTSLTQSQISATVPAGTVLTIGGHSKGRGGTLPSGKYNYRVLRNYSTVIIDVSRDFDGGVQSFKWYQVPSDTGATTAWFEAQAEMELEFSKHCEMEFWVGEENDNATLTTTSANGGTSKDKGTKGVYNWAKDVGQTLSYSGSTVDIAYLYDAKDLMLAKGVSANEVTLIKGTDLGRALEQGGVEYIGAYSGGSDFYDNMYKLGVGFNAFEFNGITFHCKEAKSLSNPLRLGNKAYTFSSSGLIIPESFENATYNGVEMQKKPSLQIGYLNNNGEDRTRIIGVIDGTTGRSIPTNKTDTSTAFVRSEWAAIVLRPEQLICMEKQS